MRIRMLVPLTAAAMLAAPSVASASFAHVITPGESLYSIAAVDGMSVDQLAAANGLSSDAQLTTGSTLMIPPQESSTANTATASTSTATASTGTATASGFDSDDAASSSDSSSSSGSYVVQPGDTLSGIAARAGTTVAALAAANGLDPAGVLPEGAVLNLSGSGLSSSAANSGSAATPVSESVPSSQPGVNVPPYPTPERVNASEVGSIADANGVPASLAQAIGWQESGFNNDLVSSADARGVMQIIPGTWDYIQRNLTGGDPLAPASASSNVRGGVLLLHSLLSATGGNPSLAAAGYYQGLQSVLRNGLYSDTQQYVNSVMALRQQFRRRLAN
jgi:N-acetylmuramoyl-L-alanine amidase